MVIHGVRRKAEEVLPSTNRCGGLAPNGTEVTRGRGEEAGTLLPAY